MKLVQWFRKTREPTPDKARTDALLSEAGTLADAIEEEARLLGKLVTQARRERGSTA